jgi:hypothetical protein
VLYLCPWGYFGGTGVLWGVGLNVEVYIGQETLRVRVLSAQQPIGCTLPFFILYVNILSLLGCARLLTLYMYCLPFTGYILLR